MILARPGPGRIVAFVVGPGFLALLTLLLFAPLLPPDTALFYRDVSQNHVPYRALTVATIQAGEAPLWNPQRGNGQPLLANPNTLVLHPTTLLFLILPLHWAVKVSVIGQIWLAAAGAWLLLRDIGLRPRAALTGAALFAFSGSLISLGNLLNLLDSAAFMPLTLFFAGRAAARAFAPWGPLAALSLAVQILAGEPSILIATLLALGALHFSHAASEGATSSVRPLGARAASLLGVGLLAAALALVGILPTVELLARSERGAGFDSEESLKWSLPPVALLNAAFPALFGDPTRLDPEHWWGASTFDAGLPLILSLYLGPAALLLAGAGLASGWRAGGARRGEAVAHAGVACVGVLMAMGRFFPPAALFLAAIPGFSSVRYPSKYFLLTTWAIALLAARGDQARDEDGAASSVPSRRSGLPRLLLPSIGVALALAAAGYGLIAAGGSMPAGPGAAGIWQAVTHGALVAGVGWFLLRWRAAAAGPCLAGLAIADLILAALPLNPVAPRSFYDEAPRLAAAAGPPGAGGRLWSRPRPRGFAFRTPPGEEPGALRPGFFWDRMTLRNATGFTSGYRFAYDRGNERLDLLPGAAIGRMLYDGKPSPLPPAEASRLLAIASADRAVTYGDWSAPGWTEQGRLAGLSDPPVVVLHGEAALPRVYLAHRIERRPDPLAALRRLREPEFDPRTTVILEEGEAPAHPGPAGGEGTGSPAAAVILEESASRVRVGVQAAGDAYLVLTDSFYPGWQATVDGAPAPIVRANAMFRAVAVKAGKHDVAFEYRPGSVRAGLAGSLAALALAMLLAIPRKR